MAHTSSLPLSLSSNSPLSDRTALVALIGKILAVWPPQVAIPHPKETTRLPLLIPHLFRRAQPLQC
ncbi:unnamed protein product [Prunus armeniaca]